MRAELGFPEGTGKQYSAGELEAFQKASETQFGNYFFRLPEGQRRKLVVQPLMRDVITKLAEDTQDSRYINILTSEQLRQLAEEYKKTPHTREFLRNFWQNLWDVWRSFT